MASSASPYPEWMSRVRSLTPSDRRARYDDWLKSLRRPRGDEAVRARDNLNRAVEQLRDAVAEARAAGVPWTTIAECMGVDVDAAEKLSTD